MSEIVELRRFLTALSGGPTTPSLPPALRRFTKSASARHRAEEADEAHGALLLRLVELARRGGIPALLALPDGALVGTLRKMARHAVVDLDPARELRRSLRLHIAAVLTEGIAPGGSWPETIVSKAGLFQRAFVREAVAAAVAEGVAATTKAVTSALAARYFVAFVAPPDGWETADSAPSPEQHVAARSAGRRLATIVRARVEAGRLRAFAGRADGHSYAALARTYGTPRATLCRWAEETTEAVRCVAREEGLLDRSSIEAAIEELAQHPSSIAA